MKNKKEHQIINFLQIRFTVLSITNEEASIASISIINVDN
jgi:hypothetical protein